MKQLHITFLLTVLMSMVGAKAFASFDVISTLLPMAELSESKVPNCNVANNEPLVMDISQVSAGYGYTMILETDGSLWACGRNRFGQLGDGTTNNCCTPKQVMTNVATVSAGYYHTMILKTDGSLWACGYNGDGELGDGTTTNCSTPKQMMTGVATVSAGGGHTLILKTDGSLWACGDNQHGQLGDGTTTWYCSVPKQVMTGVEAVSAGSAHTMILKTDGSLWACGYNGDGELGDGTTTNSSTPKQVMTSVAAVSAGGGHTMILKTDGSLWACGYNGDGELGDGTTTNSSTPKQVMTGVSAVSAGNSYTMILKTDGSLWTCGYNGDGELGDGTTINCITPKQVMTNVAVVSAGYSHTMILKIDGTLWGCGYNDSGQLGDGTNYTSYSTPVLIAQSGNGGVEPTDISKLDNAIYIEPVEAYASSTLMVPVNMKNAVAAEGFCFDLYLPEGVSFATDADGYPEVYLSEKRTTPRKTNTFESTIQADGSLRVFAASTNGGVIDGNDGEVALVKIVIGDDVAVGAHPLQLKNIAISGTDSQSYGDDTEVVQAILTIIPTVPGDANGDKKVNVSDYTAIAHFLLNNIPDNYAFKAADANGDSKVNVADLTAVAHLILYGSLEAPQQSRAKKETDKLDPQ